MSGSSGGIGGSLISPPVPTRAPRRTATRATAARAWRNPGRTGGDGAEREPSGRHPHRRGASVRPMLVSEAVGRTLYRLGGETVFGLMGSGNLAVTNAVVAAG